MVIHKPDKTFAWLMEHLYIIFQRLNPRMLPITIYNTLEKMLIDVTTLDVITVK